MTGVPAVVLASFFSDPLGAFEEIAFVVRVMSFVYILFWLFTTFQDNQLLFGFTALVAAYFVLFNSPVIIVLAAVVLLMVNGMFLQQSIMFGLFPALSRDQMGNTVDYAHQEEMMRAQNLENRLAAGERLNEQEMRFVSGVHQRQALANAQVQQFMGDETGQPAGQVGAMQYQPPGAAAGGMGGFMQAGMRRPR